MLDETVDWYRTLGTQQQSATQPSDMLLLYANQQIADQVIALTFQIARANAELLSSEAGAAAASEDAKTSPMPRRQQEGWQKLHALKEDAVGAPSANRRFRTREQIYRRNWTSFRASLPC